MDTNLKVMPVEQCKAMGKMYSSAAQFKSRVPTGYYSYREPTMLRIADQALTELAEARRLDVATHEKNIPALEMNRKVHAFMSHIMSEMQMPDGWSETDRNSRARYPKKIQHRAGWRQDLTQHCAINDGFELATTSYDRLLKEYTEYREQALRADEIEKNQKAAEEQAKLKARRADMELAAILLRYDLPLETDWPDVLDNLRRRDQRLDLAVAMRQVRGDWNDGCGAVESALGRFTIRNDEDKDIANDVLGCTHDFEDGRVFRDTNWSYDRLFDSVQDRQLVADVEAAYQHGSDE